MTSLRSENSDKFILREFRPGDRDSIVKYANNRNVSIKLRDRFPFPYTLKDADWWIANSNPRAPARNFAIDVDGQAVGGIGLELGEDVFRCSAELGYWLGEPYWGSGIITDGQILDQLNYVVIR